MRRATFEDLAEVLREQSGLIREKLRVGRTNMFIPTDGKGLRIHVSVPQDAPDELPDKITIRLGDGSDVEVPLEVTRDYQPVRLQ